jgi:hypothetical protein
MTSIQWIIGEEKGKLVLVLSIHRSLEEIAGLEELEYREAIKKIKGVHQVYFNWFKHQYGPSISLGERLLINGMHYFVFEADLKDRKLVLEQVDQQNEQFKEKIYVAEQVPLYQHSISRIIPLYRIQEHS